MGITRKRRVVVYLLPIIPLVLVFYILQAFPIAFQLLEQFLGAYAIHLKGYVDLVISVMVYVMFERTLNKIFREEWINESKIEVSVGSKEYVTDWNKGRPLSETLFGAFFGPPAPNPTFYHKVKFRITNHNTRSSQNSQLHIAVKGNPNLARLRWYCQGTDDSGKSVEKYVEQMHLENGSPHTTILRIKADPEVCNIEVPDDSMLDILYVPVGVSFNLKVSVVGLNHKRRDEFFTIELPNLETLHIEKSRSAF